jgi:hydrogenase/urease accessory protein HupE
MIHPSRTIARLSLCTGLALASPAFAHDGPHQMTYLQNLLHDLAWADTLSATLAIAAAGTMIAWRLTRRKAACAKL